LGSVLITLLIWILSKAYFADHFTNPYKYVAKTASLSTMILVCWTTLLSTRARWVERLFGGLDHVYQLHCRMGFASFLLILAHPIFLALDRLPNVPHFLRYFLFTNKAAENSGIVTFVLFLVLIGFSRWANVAYHRWKYIHEFFGFFLVVSGLHIYLTRADISKYPLLTVWVYFWLGTALLAYIYIRFLYRFIGPRFHYRVEKIQKLGGVWEVYLSPLNEFLCFQPGQYLYIAFQSPLLKPEPHPFSISSARQESFLRVSIKELGDYTSRLSALQPGDRARISGPHGRFGEAYLRHMSTDAVFIAGGIGIAPFLSILEDVGLQSLRKGHTWLIYTVQDVSHAYYHQEIQKEAAQNKRFNYIPYFSNESGFLTAEKLEKQIGNLQRKLFFICGPKPMMDALISQLRKKGVHRNEIFYEDFNYLS